jgi:hypothetical protein
MVIGDDPGGPDMHFCSPAGIHIEQSIPFTAYRAQAFQRLNCCRRGVAMNLRHDPRPVFLDGVRDAVQVEDAAPIGVYGHDLAAHPTADFRQQMTKPAETRHKHLVSRRNHRAQARLDTGPRRAVYQKGPFVGRAKDLAVEGHGLVHILGKLGIELSEHWNRHCA